MTAAEGERAAPPVRGPVLAAHVVGRDAELGVLHGAVERAVAGRGEVVLLTGEPGIGKSRLAQVTAVHAEGRGLRVLRGRAVPTSSPLAYRPLAEALCSEVRSGAVPDAPELGPFLPILGLLVPEWRGNAVRVDDSVMALAEAVLRFLRVVAADRGCLVVLEDLHWADQETLRVVEYLADNLTSERVLCLATVRDEGRSAGLQLARALHARRVSSVLQLARLHQREVAEMVDSCLGTRSIPEQVLEIAARADGIPFLVEELLAAAVASGALTVDGGAWAVVGPFEPTVPMTFSDSIRRRLDGLGDDTRTVLLAAAVVGRRFDWNLLPGVTGLRHEDVLAALRAAVDAQIVAVVPGETTFRFRHALSRDAVLAELLPPEAAALSRRALAAVEAAHPDLEEDWCELAAELAERAGDRDRAGALLMRTARRALHRGALASAETTLDRARDLLTTDDATRLEVEESLIEILSLAGKRERALEVGGVLLASLDARPDAALRRAEVHLKLARAALAATHVEEAYAFLERVRAETASMPDDEFAARVTAVRAQTAIVREPERAPPLARAALEAAERLGLPEVACDALEVLGRSQRFHDLDAAEASFARSLTFAEAHGLTLWRTRALHELGTIDMLRGGSVSRLEEARDLARGQGALGTAAVVDVQIAAALVLSDDPDAATVVVRRSAQLARRYRLDRTLASAVALEAYIHARAGRRDEMERCAQEALAHASGAPDVAIKTSSAAAFLAFVEEDRDAARHHLSAAVELASTGPGGDHVAIPGAGVLALVRQLDGTGDELGEFRLAEGSAHFLARAFLRYADAVAAGRAGHGDRADALVADGDHTLGDHRWLRHLGRRLVAEPALADGWGQPVPWLREALAFFDRRGEQQLASACRSLLRQAGVAVPRRRGDQELPGPLRAVGVTAREFEVLGLLARGLATKQIAARLYLSPRTVERHVANIAVKVGVGGRSELVAYAARTLRDTPPSTGRA